MYNTVIILCLLVFSDVSSKSCNFNVNVLQILHNEGFHRNLSYGIDFEAESEGERWKYEDCRLAVDQTLPPGVFANPDELWDLRRLSKINAETRNPVNIELPAEESTPNSVLIFGRVRNSGVTLWLPVHARYHIAGIGGGRVRNEIEPPKVYLQCPERRFDDCIKRITPVTFQCNSGSQKKCNWRAIPFTMLTDTVVWDVPIGNTNHYHLVSVGSSVVVVLGSLYVLNALHAYKCKVMKKA